MDELTQNDIFLRKAVDLARFSSEEGHGGPFGALVVKDGIIVGQGCNQVTITNDPSAHAEVVAIREACKKLGTFQLRGCIIYTSCEPCPMCLGAIYWARPDKVYFASTRFDAADAGFDDALIYKEMLLPSDQRSIPMILIPDDQALAVFKEWKANPDKLSY